mmetsp:Transcript_27253/g.62852  ORF Transcript_27253/g.62852 Transcript_27253/m.62852 type:complete len:467 (+) Transcript_27253:87-1487(+)|eukprot:CAMPEP_0114552334 /NCGR_PEP_ID=MMETSP0114-20121206/7072_1 /TAXON_ID=31324 /ORGANISM="Goniomonas sp, Strain m" /LENGTH=466 /DNA_ID=CAMNT_0001737209 /DNA_START=87 /DNA_END=1487 /DNA_ORIENTATION=+
MDTQTNNIIIKATYGGEIRRTRCDPTLAALMLKLNELFSFQGEVVLQYTDEDGDLVTFSSDSELQEALAVCGSMLRLTISNALIKTEDPLKVKGAKRALKEANKAIKGADKAAAKATKAELKAQEKAARKAEKGAESSSSDSEEGDWISICRDKQKKQARKLAAMAETEAHKLVDMADKAETKGRARALKLAEKAEFKAASFAMKMQAKAEQAEKRAAKFAEKMAARAERAEKAAEKAANLDAEGRRPAVPWKARFVDDVTIPDGTVLAPNTEFTKIWRMRNAGPSEWPEQTSLRLVGKGSDRMGAPDAAPLPRAVAPDTEVDISVPMVAPAAAGRYQSYWRLAAPDGRKFGQRVWTLVNVNGAAAAQDAVVVGTPLTAQEGTAVVVGTPLAASDPADDAVVVSPIDHSAAPGEQETAPLLAPEQEDEDLQTKLKAMGFMDETANAKALSASAGNVDLAVEALLAQ